VLLKIELSLWAGQLSISVNGDEKVGMEYFSLNIGILWHNIRRREFKWEEYNVGINVR
jgi:hypothetical protein